MAVFREDFLPMIIEKLEFDLTNPEGKIEFEGWPFLIFRTPGG